MNWLQFLLPEIALVTSAVLVMTLGIAKPGARGMATATTLLGMVLAFALLLGFPAEGTWFGGILAGDALSRLFRAAILCLAVVSALFAHDSFPKKHYAESLALILFSATGMLLLVGTEDLLMIFLALELTGIPLYILAAFDKDRRTSAEAGLKFFLVGSIAAGFLLYGMSLVYGVAGSTNLGVISRAETDPLLLAGIVLVLGGFAFKIAAVPFHLWAPDVYEGAPTAAAALVASGSKVAGVFVLAKLLYGGFAAWAGGAAHMAAGWMPLLALIATASILLGNLAALAQRNVKRLLAYSAIAHGGYLLIGLAAGQQGITPTLFYVVLYALTAAGAFGAILLVEKRRGCSDLDDFRGLSTTNPLLAIALLIFFVSFAGIPPFAGFFGKFYLFAAAVENPNLLWLVGVAVALNAVSLYYYLIVLKYAFVLPREDAEPSQALQAPLPAPARLSTAAVLLLALAVLVIGLFPEILLRFFP